MPEAAPYQVVDAVATLLDGTAALSDYTILTDNSDDAAFSEADYPLVSIGLTLWNPQPDVEQGQTRHEIEIEFEVVSGKEQAGIMGRNNVNAICAIITALSADRTLGGLIEDIQESQVSPAGQTGIDASATVLVTSATAYTPRDDWFTLVS